MLMVVVDCGDNNYENAYASHYFLFIKRHFLMAFSEKKCKSFKPYKLGIK